MAEIALTEDEAIKIPQVRRHESQPQQKSEDGPGKMPIDTSNLKDFTGTLKAFKRKNWRGRWWIFDCFKFIAWQVFVCWGVSLIYNLWHCIEKRDGVKHGSVLQIHD